MTGIWEQRLQNLAEGGVPWDLPTRWELAGALEALKQVLDSAAEDPGLAGASGDAARAQFTRTSLEIDDQLVYLREHVPSRLDQANEVRQQARDSAASLPQGQMDPGQQAMVRGAAAGASIIFGPVAFLAGEGAGRAINDYMASQREAAAREAVEKHSNQLDDVALDPPPPFTGGEFPPPPPPPPPPPSYDPDGGTGSTSGRSFQSYPDWDMTPGGGSSGGGNVGGGNIGGGGEIGGGGNGGGEVPTGPGPGDYGPFPTPTPTPVPGGPAPIDIGNVPPDPTPDGPVIGSPTLPGGISTMPGGGLVGGTPGGPGAGIGSGLGAGLVAGGGGALALGRMGGGGAGAGGSLFGGGTGGAGGSAKAGGGARSGGLLGKTPGGAGLGARGVGGLAAGGGAPGSTAARGAGVRGGATGLGGAGGAGGTGTAGGSAKGGARGVGVGGGSATGGSAKGGARGVGGGSAAGGGRGAASGSRGVGGMGGPGSRSERKDEAARGLGGPIAPRMEDDEEIAPRSENAQAGGRDE